MARILVRAARATARSVALHHLPLRFHRRREENAMRYTVGMTRWVIQRGEIEVEAASPDDARRIAETLELENTNIEDVATGNGAAEFGATRWIAEDVTARPQVGSGRHRPAAAIGYDG